MNLSPDLIVAICLAYVAFLFAVAFAAERRAARGRPGWLGGPWIYTLSLSIYCTAWTFYGAVGYAARSGLEFVTIYLGPTLVMVGWWALLRKLVRIGRTQRITSIADLISSRYGKSPALGGGVTLLAVVGSTPYIALQLQSVTVSFAAFAQASGTPQGAPVAAAAVAQPEAAGLTALGIAAGLALFTILFGTRRLDAHERHHGVVTAIAVEAVVKLVALLAVGAFVVWGLAGGARGVFEMIEASPIAAWELRPGRWAGLIFLSAAAFLCLPRMFHVLVVENADERQLVTASWAFPLYLFAMSLFVVPIAVVGLDLSPPGANPDLFVLTVPLAAGQGGLATLAFLGGFSSATSMVIVAAIALSTMVSNHIALPIWLGRRRGGAALSGDVRDVVLRWRRLSIVGVLGLGWLYYRVSGGGGALAAIGLISFVGIAQVLPALLGGIFWRGATRRGAVAGLGIGSAIWVWTLFLPSFGDGAVLSAAVMAEGPWGAAWLRPHALFGIEGVDPLMHALLWSLIANSGAFVAVSLADFPGVVERLQGASFVNVFARGGGGPGWSPGAVETEDLLVMAQRILGGDTAQRLFRGAAQRQGKEGYLPDPTPAFLDTLERELAGSVGAATAHAMLGQIAGGSAVTVEELMRVADETAQMMEARAGAEAQSAELARTARALRDANAALTEIGAQKDEFLGKVSHELRTPMTSILAFAEILRGGQVDPDDRARHAALIHEEARRLTRLLDDLLDLSVLESGQITLQPRIVSVRDVLDRALAASQIAPLTVLRDPASEAVRIDTDPDRLAQVFINLISNAQKYCAAEAPTLRVSVRRDGAGVTVDFADNGSGIPTARQTEIFEKFARGPLSVPMGEGRAPAPPGAGLGLAICREIVTRLGGTVTYLPGQHGAFFRVALPVDRPEAA